MTLGSGNEVFEMKVHTWPCQIHKFLWKRRESDAGAYMKMEVGALNHALAQAGAE
jgi:hypothetical protein